MSLVREPRLWTKRYSYLGWKALPENQNLSEEDALELFKHEERRWNAYEEELRNQYASRQSTLVDQINQLDSYIFDTLNIETFRQSDIILGGGSVNIKTVPAYAGSSAFIELITDAGVVLVTDEGLFLTPDSPSTTDIP